MSVRKFGTSWWVDFTVERSRYRLRSPDNSSLGARAYEALLRRRLARGEPLLPAKEPPANPTFDAFAHDWFSKYVTVNNKPSEQDQKRYALKDHLGPFFGKLLLRDIAARHVEAFKAHQVSRRYAPKTINNQLGILRKCLATAEEWGTLTRVPRIKPLKTQLPKFTFLSDEEAARLVNAAPPGLWRAMILVALKTGLRSSELIGLEWEDVHLERRVLCVRQANVRGVVGTTKSSCLRYLPLTSAVVAALNELPRVHELVFPYRGTWMRYEVARRHLRHICLTGGIKQVGWHALRHTFASSLVAAGAPLKVVQDLMGHSSITMTMRYAHMAPHVLRDAISFLEPRVIAPQLKATGGQSAPVPVENLPQRAPS